MKKNLRDVFNLLGQTPIVYNPAYKKMFKNTACGVYFSQLMYWFCAVNFKEFYKSDDEIMEETGLTINEIRGAKKKLKSRSWATVKRRETTHYFFEIEGLINDLKKVITISEINELELVKLTNPISEINESHHVITDNTDNTTDNTIKKEIENENFFEDEKARKGRQYLDLEMDLNKDQKFQEFWKIFDYKSGEKLARLEFQKLSWEQIDKALEHVPKYVNANPEKKYRGKAVNYLKAEKFEDEIIDPNEKTKAVYAPPTKKTVSTFEKQRSEKKAEVARKKYLAELPEKIKKMSFSNWQDVPARIFDGCFELGLIKISNDYKKNILQKSTKIVESKPDYNELNNKEIQHEIKITARKLTLFNQLFCSSKAKIIC